MGNPYPETLFRRQAVKTLSERPFGRPICATPRPWPWITALSVVLAASGSLFLATAEYARKETVRGWLVARGGVARISHDASGVVERVAGAPGDYVAAGDPIIYLSRETFLRDGRSSKTAVLAELERQIHEVDRRAALLRAEAKVRERSVLRQLESLTAQTDALMRARTEQRHRLRAAADKLQRLRSLAANGAVADWEILSQQDEKSALSQALNQMEQETIALIREHDKLAEQSNSLPLELKRAVSALESERSRLLQRITEHSSGQHLVLKSPVAGTLAAVEVHSGEAVVPDQLLATVMPQNPELGAEVFVPSSAVGFIEHGQRVRLTYDAFPRQQFGTFAGEVAHVSAFVLMPRDVPETFQLRQATFKVKVSLEADAIEIESGSAPLRPGMLLVAEIVLEERSLLAWLLEPIRLRRKDAA